MMRLAPFLVYLLAAALILPGTLLAAEDDPPAPAGDPAQAAPDPAAPDPAAPDPAAPPEQAAPPEEAAPPVEPAPAQPVPADEPQPAPAEPAAPAQAEQAQAPDEPAAEQEPTAAKGKAKKRAKAAASQSVTIRDFEFGPGNITVNVGDTVTWSNSGPTGHSATANDGSFDTGILDKGQSGSHTFDKAGTFSYICTPHPFMKGTVTVAASSAGGDTGSTSGESGGTAGTTDTDTGTDATGSGLPSTGSNSEPRIIAGLVLLLLGALMHRRSRRVQAPAGRIGW